jgi:hypothetical protein
MVEGCGKANLGGIQGVGGDFDPVVARDVDSIVPQAVIFFLLSPFAERGRWLWRGRPDEESCDGLSEIPGVELEVAREAGELVSSGGNVSSLSGFLRGHSEARGVAGFGRLAAW